MLAVAPPYRAVFYGLLLYGGLRFGEAAAARRAALSAREPLGELLIDRSWACREHEVRATKTGDIRHVPVHPRLAELISAAGFEFRRMFARAPVPSDLIAPFPRTVRGRTEPYFWHEATALKWWRRDLATAGVVSPATGPHRLHSARHTFISTLMRQEVPKHVWATITHRPPREDAADGYAHPDWATLCKAVLRMRVGT